MSLTAEVPVSATATRAGPRPTSRVQRLDPAWGLVVVAAVMAALGLAIALRWSTEVMPHSLIVASVYPAVGALIVSRRRRNAVGWLLIFCGAVNALVALTNAWAPVALDIAPGSLPGGRAVGQVAAWLADGVWILSHGVLLTLVPLLFPDGKLPSKRWLPVAVFNVSAIAVQFAAPLSVASQIRLRNSSYEFYPDERLAEKFGGVGYDLVLTGGVLATLTLVWRLTRMPRDERGVFVWFAAGAIAAVALLVPLDLIPEGVVREVVRVASVITIPVGAAVAILHRRAYGIDVVVNRTLVYALLTALLTVVYLGAVALVDLVVSASSTFSAVVAAGATALALSPVRHRLQRGVNQVMYGRRDEPHVVSAAVGSRLDAVAGGADTLSEVTDEIATALRLSYVALEANAADGTRKIASTGTPTALLERLPLVAQGEEVGSLVVGGRRGQDHLAARDLDALREVAPMAAVAVRQVQLTDDLRRARSRLAAALEEERRRIRRDLHDGLGPSLATVVMGLEEARAVHRSDAERTDRLLAHLKTQTRSAIDEIRSLVYGLRPPALDELGLAAAIRQAVDATFGRSSVDISLDVPASLPELPAAVEVAAYRIVQEAITNVVRHSAASHALVVLASEGDVLVLEIRDNGHGLPEPLTPGVGITSLRERAADIGGTVTFATDGGTIVSARLPVEA